MATRNSIWKGICTLSCRSMTTLQVSDLQLEGLIIAWSALRKTNCRCRMNCVLARNVWVSLPVQLFCGHLNLSCLKTWILYFTSLDTVLGMLLYMVLLGQGAGTYDLQRSFRLLPFCGLLSCQPCNLGSHIAAGGVSTCLQLIYWLGKMWCQLSKFC